MKIHNPYRKRLENFSTLANEDFKLYSGIIRNSVKVFDEGVDAAIEALKPKKFADELPEEEQLVILLSETYKVSESFYFRKELISGNMCSFGYGTYTHWLPFPKLD